MKVLWVLMLVGLPYIVRAANGDCTNDAFEKYSDTISNAVRSAISEKRIDDALMLIESWLESFTSLDDCSREQYKHLEMNGYYYSARLNAAANYRAEVYTALKRAVELGYSNYHQIRRDKYLAPFLKDPNVTEIFEAICQRGDYLTILRDGGGYEHTSNEIISFQYLMNDTALKRLYLKYNLDSIAGKGTESQRMIQLMNWVHTMVTYDGNAETPMPRNADSLITRCKRDGLKLDCRGMATILNEVYLATGFHSRLVVCKPKDTLDKECHVITAVYSNSLGKWIWMDPANNAYLTNTKGDLLGISDVRRMMIEGEPILLNNDANINGTYKRAQDEYLYEYMAKNLYWFESPVISGYNAETLADGKRFDYIRLLPADVDRIPFQKYHYPYGTVTVTTDESQFWKNPL